MTQRFTRANLRHALAVLRRGATPAATVYESIGSDFFLAPAPGWLNLGLWEGPGEEAEAEAACVRLVERLAGSLPPGGDVLDVGNGLATQEPVIARVVRPRRLVAVNVTLAQLRAGRRRLAEADAHGVGGDAVRLPFADSSFDGVISVEAAFHFPSRARFFREAHRVLRPGGVLSMSDVPVLRMPRGPRELIAGLAQLRVWGLRASSAATPGQIAAMAKAAGFRDVRVELAGERVIDPALRLTRKRLDRMRDLPATLRLPARFLLAQSELLRRRGVLEYLLLTAHP